MNSEDRFVLDCLLFKEGVFIGIGIWWVSLFIFLTTLVLGATFLGAFLSAIGIV